MSRAQMKAEIEREQDRGDAAWESLTAEEQERIAISCEWQKVADEVRQHFADSEDWKRYDTQDHLATADYYEGLLAGETDELPF